MLAPHSMLWKWVLQRLTCELGTVSRGPWVSCINRGSMGEGRGGGGGGGRGKEGKEGKEGGGEGRGRKRGSERKGKMAGWVWWVRKGGRGENKTHTH